jgi:chloramphenicol 3-O phosphotransferase
LIGVRCPLEVLKEREKSRGDRTLGQARLQHELVHAHGVYDLEVDTAQFSAAECARQIQAYLQDCAQAGDLPRAFKRLKEQQQIQPDPGTLE